MRVLRPGCRMASARLSVPPCLIPLLNLAMLLPFSFIPGVCGNTREVQQYPEYVSAAAGENVTLSCTVTSIVIGPVRWFKGSGAGRTLIYSDKKEEGSFSRISRLSPDSNTDFTISINNISTEDIGTYYCIKFRKIIDKKDEEHTSGRGSNLSVNARPSAPILTGPTDRVEVGKKVNLTCTSDGFFPKNITVTWLKDGIEIRDAESKENTGERNHSFWVNSTLPVTLCKQDIKSRMTCQIKHDTSSLPLNATKNMSDFIRVSPSVTLQVTPAPTVLVNTCVKITCSVKSFYPQNLTITLNMSIKDAANATSQDPRTRNDDGTYNVARSLQLNATEQWNQSVFTCKAVHQGAEFKSEEGVLLIITKERIEAQTNETEKNKEDAKKTEVIQYSVIAACLALLLLLVLAIVIFMRSKKKRDKDTANRRSMRSSRTAQALDTKDLTYADLEIQQRPPNQHATVAQNDHCEYASVQTGAQPRKDNLTYADLDTVRLNQGPRKAGARPAEDSSEYAEVQIRKK